MSYDAEALARQEKRFSKRRKDNVLISIEKGLLLTWIISDSVTVHLALGATMKAMLPPQGHLG
ncbi:hypothetical protein [Pseudomonas thivervalensis]|uniref:hypothetical protein n=1 Tax=Pseudomonas thivervalensis TaxID=86265 RepID=UPI00069FA292|nr:hypothetical protein [Pseudomonas thivervalensis]